MFLSENKRPLYSNHESLCKRVAGIIADFWHGCQGGTINDFIHGHQGARLWEGTAGTMIDFFHVCGKLPGVAMDDITHGRHRGTEEGEQSDLKQNSNMKL
jgi:hypothetical protein